MISKLYLPDVTLFAIDACNIKGILRAVEICQRRIEFGNVVVINERLFPGDTLQQGREGYSKFMIKELHKYITTSHALTIHHDGFIQNPYAWTDEWLKLDYIGAPWEWYEDKKVGNGGFSLRSKRLCEILAKDDKIDKFMPEDDMICRHYHDYLVETYGIKYGTVEQARRFSIEGWAVSPEERKYNGQFGFHSPWPTDLPIPINE